MQDFMMLLYQLTFSFSKTPLFALLGALSHAKYCHLQQRPHFPAFRKPQPDHAEYGS